MHMSAESHRSYRHHISLELEVQAIVSCQRGHSELNSGPLQEEYVEQSLQLTPSLYVVSGHPNSGPAWQAPC